MAARNKKDFRRVPRWWINQTSAHRPRATRADRSACFFFYSFSRYHSSILGFAAMASAITPSPALRSSSTISISRRTISTPTKVFAGRAWTKITSPDPAFERPPATSTTISPSAPRFSGCLFFFSRTRAFFSRAPSVPPSPPTVFPPLTASPWPSPLRSMVFSACSCPSALHANMSKSAGRSSPPFPSGGPARSPRSFAQWLILALIAGLMLNVYYANAMLLAVLAVEALRQYLSAFRPGVFAARDSTPRIPELLLCHLLFTVVLVICLLPTFLTRFLIYGNSFESGYIPLRDWNWFSPYFLAVLFSSNHGLLSWTPILLLAIVGLFLFWRREPLTGGPLLAGFLAFYFFIASYPDWAGISSYGNRFFVSLTSFFILGLAVFFHRAAPLFRSRRAALAAACTLLAVSTLWNAGLIFQWGSHLIPARGPVSFSEIIRNQFFVVPRRLAADLHAYVFKRKALMQQIEDRDLQQLEKNPLP